MKSKPDPRQKTLSRKARSAAKKGKHDQVGRIIRESQRLNKKKK